jgi:hypothetical protein
VWHTHQVLRLEEVSVEIYNHRQWFNLHLPQVFLYLVGYDNEIEREPIKCLMEQHTKRINITRIDIDGICFILIYSI